MKKLLIFLILIFTSIRSSSAQEASIQMPEELEKIITKDPDFYSNEEFKKVKEFVDAKRDNINARTKNGKTLLMIYACKSQYSTNDSNALEFLTTHAYCDRTIKDHNGWNFLHHLAYYGSFVHLNEMLCGRQHLIIGLDEVTSDGLTALDLANKAHNERTYKKCPEGTAKEEFPDLKVNLLKSYGAFSASDKKFQETLTVLSPKREKDTQKVIAKK